MRELPKLTATRHPCRLGKMVTYQAGGPVRIMDKKHLQSILENLHRELASADSIDEESRVLLQDLAAGRREDWQATQNAADVPSIEIDSRAACKMQRCASNQITRNWPWPWAKLSKR